METHDGQEEQSEMASPRPRRREMSPSTDSADSEGGNEDEHLDLVDRLRSAGIFPGGMEIEGGTDSSDDSSSSGLHYLDDDEDDLEDDDSSDSTDNLIDLLGERRGRLYFDFFCFSFLFSVLNVH
jgi:hypothetical protein